MKFPRIAAVGKIVARAWAELRATKGFFGHPRDADAFFISGFGGTQTASGVPVNEDVALRFSAVFACVRILSETIASLPLITYRRLPGGGKVRATEHPLFHLLKDRPNLEQTSFEWREMMQGHLAIWGNAYSVIDFNNAGEVSQLIPLDPRKTIPRRLPDGELVYDSHPGGQRRTFPAERILHLKWMSQDGITGISPIQLYREAIGLALAAEEFTSRFFSNDASPSGVLTHPGELKELGMQNLRDSIDKQTRGVNKSHNFLILEEGMQWSQIGVPAKDAELILTRKFQIEEIARIYRMQLHKIGVLENATFSNIEEQNIEHVVDTIRPWAVRWEQSLALKLIPPEEQDEIFVEYNLDALLRGDSKSRGEFYNTLWSMGVFSGNDIATLENLNPFEGGDQRFVPLNFIPLEAAGDMPASNDTPPRGALAEGEERGETSGSLNTIELRSVGSRRRLQAASKRLFLEAGQRIVSREVNEIRRMIKATIGAREAVGTGTLRQRITDFYANFPVVARDIMLPVLLAYGEGIHAAAAEEIGAAPVISATINKLITEYAENFGVRHSIGSRNQLLALINETDGAELEAVLLKRLSEWADTGAGKIANREPIQSGAAIARTTYRENGITKIRWVTVGKNCPLCDQLSGKVVGITRNFVEGGETVDPKDGKTSPLTVRRGILHPQLHGGCDCMVTAA